MGIDSPSVVLLIIGSALFGLGALVRYGIKQAEKIRGAWRNFADRIGGTYERGRGGVSRIVAPAPRGTVTIDTYLRSDGENTVTYTRLIVPYTPTQPFYFLLRPRGRTGRLLTRLTAKAVERAGAKLPPDQRAYLELEHGGEDIPLNEPELDRRYSLRATDPEAARRLFAQPAIRRLLLEQKACTLSLAPPNLRKDLGNTVPVLGYQQVGMLPNTEALHSAYDLMVAIMQEMHALNLTAPDVASYPALAR